MSIDVNSQITNINNIQPKAQVAFRAQTAPVKDYPPDTVEIQGKKKGLSKGTKWGIGVAILGTIALTIGLLTRKPSQVKEVLDAKNIRENFSIIFKKDFSENEVKTMVKKYEQIFKIDNVDDFSKKIFEQIKKDSGNENKTIEFIINKCESGLGRQAGFASQRGVIFMDIECTSNIISNQEKKNVFGRLIHEFQHVRQHSMAYNVDPVRFAKAATKDIDIGKVIKELEYILNNNPNQVSKLGGEKAVKDIIQGLKLKKTEYINLFRETAQEKILIMENIKKTFGPSKGYKIDSEEYKIGLKYLENFENYIQPSDDGIKYSQQLLEKEAFEAQEIAKKILEYMHL